MGRARLLLAARGCGAASIVDSPACTIASLRHSDELFDRAEHQLARKHHRPRARCHVPDILHVRLPDAASPCGRIRLQRIGRHLGRRHHSAARSARGLSRLARSRCAIPNACVRTERLLPCDRLLTRAGAHNVFPLASGAIHQGDRRGEGAATEADDANDGASRIELCD